MIVFAHPGSKVANVKMAAHPVFMAPSVTKSAPLLVPRDSVTEPLDSVSANLVTLALLVKSSVHRTIGDQTVEKSE